MCVVCISVDGHVFNRCNMDVLDLHDPEAGAWLAEYHVLARPAKRSASPGRGSEPAGKRAALRDPSPHGRMHLLVGCSVARDSRMDTAGDDLLLNRAKGGETWARLHRTLPGHIAEWRRAAGAFGVSLGSVIFWLSGNDAYGRGTGENVFATMPTNEVESMEKKITETLAMARASASSVVVLGPLPRIAFDNTLPWEHTAAYKMDRKTKAATTDDEFISIGQALTKKLGRRSRHLLTDGCQPWFGEDGIHLSPAGYRKVAAVHKFPTWVVLRAAAAE